MIAKRFTAVAISLVSACILTACHGSSTGSNTGPEAAGKPSNSATSPAATTNGTVPNKTSNTPGGIVLSFCPSASKGIRNVEFVNPSVKDAVKTYSFVMEPMKYKSIADCNSDLVGAKMRAAFNGDMTEVAAANDLWHTGVIKKSGGFQDLTTKFVDLSTGLRGKPAVSTIQQSAGTFGPDGQLYFVQKESELSDAKLMKVNPNGGAPKAANASTNLQGFDPTDDGSQLFFMPGNKTPQTDGLLYEVRSPDASQFIRAGDGTITYGRPGTDGTTTEPNYGHTLLPFAYAGKNSFYGVTDDTLVLATISGTTVKEQPLLLPQTGATIIDPTLSPDDTSIAYIEETDSTRALYVVSIRSGKPQKIMSLPRTVLGARILDWTVAK